MKRFVQATIFPALFTLVPCAFLPELYLQKEPWIVWIVGFLSIWTQPAASYVPTSSFYADPRDSNTARGIIMAIYFVGGFSFVAFAFLTRPVSSIEMWLSLAIGVLFAIVGLILRVLAIKALGDMFTTQVRIVENHKVVRSGPFRFVRHPSYSGAILMFSGIPLIYGLWWFSPIAFTILAWAYWHRLKVEEDVLISHFQDEYKSYQMSTPALFPSICCRSS